MSMNEKENPVRKASFQIRGTNSVSATTFKALYNFKGAEQLESTKTLPHELIESGSVGMGGTRSALKDAV